MFSHSTLGVGSVCLSIWSSLCTPAWGAPADSIQALSPKDAVHAALFVHPAVLDAQTDLAYARGTRAESWMYNPQAQVMFDAEKSVLQLQQPLSLTGAGWQARRAAGAMIDASEARLRRARLVAAAQVRHAYVQAVVSVGTVRVAMDGVELAGRLRAAVSRQGEEGEASKLDLRLARLAEVQAASRLMDARHQEVSALRALAQLVARDVAGESLVGDPMTVAPQPSGKADSQRSDVIAAASGLDAAKANLRAQRAAAIPPVSVGAYVETEAGRTLVGPAISMALPLARRNQSARGTARGRLAKAEARVKTLDALVSAEQRTAQQWTLEADALSNVVVQNPIDEAHAALKSIELGYLAGELDLSDTVLLQNEVLQGEAAAIELRGRVAVARLDWMLSIEDVALLGGAQ